MPKKKGMPAKQPDMPAMPQADDHYKVERDFNTLMDAQEIHGDEERLKKVHAHAKQKKGHIRSILDLKNAYNAVAKEEAGEGE